MFLNLRLRSLSWSVALWGLIINPSWADNTINILYLQWASPKPLVLSNLDPIPDDLGIAGARLGINDANTTGRFLGNHYSITVHQLTHQDAYSQIQSILKQSQAQYVLLDMPAEKLLTVVRDQDHRDFLFFNISAYDDDLRGRSCARHVLHTLPSYAMRSDALMQFMVQKRWSQLALIRGQQPADLQFAAALKNAAKKFKLTFRSEIDWPFDEDIRRSTSKEVPRITQKLGDYDVLLIADERNDFARYVKYQTWEPRPVAGADGLQAVGWSNALEAWGAVQLQSRFTKLASRAMQDEDYAAWAAVRAIDEAIIRLMQQVNTEKPITRDDVRAYLLSERMTLAGFKGQPLSFRSWNGQMRQPIALVHHSATVAMAPIEGFLHKKNPLDSLGEDYPQSKCSAFN